MIIIITLNCKALFLISTNIIDYSEYIDILLGYSNINRLDSPYE
ncbi:Uncharacterized protein YR821_0135 [Yersinia ruckeri]|uniref:Uncharacterized protein n=1 Tax=Yersinia ruckeri TaxID=29486 RepID=A0A0A8V864_YERRU|nr:hypothetical protein yruck0001_70 [Yersinia ruckeri ATCC 29473]QTD75067.1 Uncharacterized protein YR821_0135 [Yersinia ruckeri]CEK25962.1 hypothetical protein CSF007_0840 [Yersinia ruckeri]